MTLFWSQLGTKSTNMLPKPHLDFDWTKNMCNQGKGKMKDQAPFSIRSKEGRSRTGQNQLLTAKQHQKSRLRTKQPRKKGPEAICIQEGKRKPFATPQQEKRAREKVGERQWVTEMHESRCRSSRAVIFLQNFVSTLFKTHKFLIKRSFRSDLSD